MRAYASGVVPVKLDMKTGGTLADVKDGETGYLEASETGTAQIVWKQYTTGSGGWGLVRLPFDFGPHRLGFDAIVRIDSAYPDDNFSGESRITQSGNEGTRRQAFLLHAEHPFRRLDFVSAAVAYAAKVTVTRADCGGWGDWLKSSVQAVSFVTEDFDMDDVTWNTAPDRTSPESARSAPVMMRYPNTLTPGVSAVLISGGQYVDAGILAQQILSAPSGADIHYGLWLESEAGSYPAPWWTSYECQTDCDRVNSRVFLR